MVQFIVFLNLVKETAGAKWFKNGREFRDSEFIHITEERTVFKVTFDKVTVADTATYLCKIGVLTTEAKLHVLGK